MIIGVGTDGSETAERAVDFAMDMAERYKVKLLIASAYRPVSEDRIRKERDEAPQEIKWSINPTEEVDAILRTAEEQAKERGLEYVSEARNGDPADVLCDIAADHDVDVMVVGNKGMDRRILGSVPNTVSHKAPCSVMIVKTAYALVVVEAGAGLLPEPPGFDELAHARGNLCPDLLADRDGHVEADEVEQPQRAHRVTGAQLHAGVDRLGLELELDHQPHGVEQQREQQPIDHEAGRVGNLDSGLPQLLAQRRAPRAGVVVGGGREHELDERHLLDRVEHVQPYEAAR